MSIIDRRLLFSLDWGLIAITLVLFSIGIVNLYSASGVRIEDGVSISGFYQRQLMWGGLGAFCLLIIISVDYRHFHTLIIPFFAITVILLIAVPLIGKTVYGAKRWIDLGFFNIQPSELAKITVLIMGAKILSNDGSLLDWKRLLQVLSICFVPVFLILSQPDLGTALTVLFILCGMIMYHGIEWRVLKVLLVAMPLLAPLGWFGLRDYQKQRILTFLNPGDDPLGSSYQIIQSQIAIGSGKVFGKGFLEGTQSQLRFLPEKHSDFAIAVYGEEFGFIGCTLLLFCFSIFLLKLVSIVGSAKDRFGSNLVVGIFLYFIWQFLINIGMVAGIMPVVGIPLPFLSYGGTATIVNFVLIGIALNVSMRKSIFTV